MPRKLARPKGGGSSSPLELDMVVAGKYRIERVLGQGGMGTVYAAHHELLDRKVAIKVLFERDREATARFLQEARSAARVQSEHAAQVKDIDTLDDGAPFIVMDYLEGADLGSYVERKRMFPPPLIVDYMLQAMEAIAQAHAHGIVHRDLKPSNLFLAVTPDGSSIIKVLDFGISKPTFGAVSAITSSRSVLGSPPYMSPEQVRSPRSVDTRTDIWSLGVVMYELLTGKMPFEGDEVGELFAGILEKEPNPIRATHPRVAEALEQVVARCMAKKREERFADVGEFARALGPMGTGAQRDSVDKIVSTLARGHELMNPRRLAETASGDVTAPDEIEARAIAPELAPTASTVGRGRLLVTLKRVSPRARIVAAGVGGAAAIALVVLTVTFNREPAPTPRLPAGMSVLGAPDGAHAPSPSDTQGARASVGVPPSTSTAVAAPPPTSGATNPTNATNATNATNGTNGTNATNATKGRGRSNRPVSLPAPRLPPAPASATIASVPPPASAKRASPVHEDELNKAIRLFDHKDPDPK